MITKATWGGALKYVFDLASHLPRADFDVAVAYGEPGKLSQMLREKKIMLHEVRSLGRDIALFSDIMSLWQIGNVLRRARPDVLHVNSSKAAALGALAGRLIGVKRIIFTAHGWPFKEDRNMLANAVIYVVSWFTAFCSHATIVVSKTDLAIGKRMPFVRKKIHFVPLGIAAPHFLPRDEAARSLGIDTQAPRIVSLAELTKNKGIRFGIDAIAKLKELNIPCHYYIIGDGELREELEEYAIQKQVETRTTFCGFVKDAAQYLKAFDVFLLPSIKEGMPYVLLEAAEARLPIVATDVVDASFSFATLVPPGNAGVLAEMLERAIESKHSAREAGFPLSEMVERTVHLY